MDTYIELDLWMLVITNFDPIIKSIILKKCDNQSGFSNTNLDEINCFRWQHLLFYRNKYSYILFEKNVEKYMDINQIGFLNLKNKSIVASQNCVQKWSQ